MNEIILASGSPRRRELLQLIGCDFKVDYMNIEETIDYSLSHRENVENLALLKASAVSEKYKNNWVIGSDTIVCMGDRIIGKPIDEDDAKTILTSLSGKKHNVITGVCIMKGDKKICFSETTYVYMDEISEREIINYISIGEPMDKAGAYGIQGKGALLINKIEGDFYNGMGLPVHRLYKELKEIGVI